ncbi:MAG: DUF1638 domain-containing protein [Actinobacteria bacterium]|nr:DUF1638 domain-containing protein [Actinomycetota bacterium]
MKNIAVVCDVMKNDFLGIVKSRNINNLDFIFMEQQLHNTPDIMRQKLQEEIDKIDNSYRNIILGYGLCSNGVAGLTSESSGIIIPKVDDCISLFLGSKEKYLEEFKKDPATYYLCKGWIEYGGDPYRGYLLWTGKEDKIPREWLRGKERYGLRKYDEKTARILVAELLKNYKRIVLINNNNIEEIHRKYVNDMITFLNEILDRQMIFEEIEGSSSYIEKLASGYWKPDNNFIRINPKEKILQEYFFK